MTRTKKALFFGIFTVLFVFLLQTSFRNGFWWDDIVYSVKSGYMKLAGDSLGRAIFKEIEESLKVGRFVPVGGAQLNAINFIGGGEREATRLIQMILVFINAIQVLLLALHVTKNYPLALLSAFLFVPLVQYRISPGYNYVEPISGLAALLPVCLLFTLLAVHGTLLALERKRAAPWMFVSALSALLASLTYELGTVSFLIAMTFIAASDRQSGRRKTLSLSAWVVASALAYLALVLWARGHQLATYEGTELGQWRHFFRGAFVQALGTLPITYATLIDHHQLMDPLGSILADPIFLSGFFATSLLLILLYGPLRRASVEQGPAADRFMWVLGAILFAFPCVLMGISKGYQTQQVPGMAYLPVYFSYFGLALLLALLVRRSAVSELRWKRVATAIPLILTLSFSGGFHFYYNFKVFDFLENSLTYERDGLHESMKSGLFEGLDDRAVVLSKVPILYSSQDHYRAFAAAAIPHPPYFLAVGHAEELPVEIYGKRDFYLLEGEVRKTKDAWFALSRLDLTEREKTNLNSVPLDDKRSAYVRFHYLTSRLSKSPRHFTAKKGGETVGLDLNAVEKKPIRGNFLRSIYRQPQVVSSIRTMDDMLSGMAPGSLRSD